MLIGIVGAEALSAKIVHKYGTREVARGTLFVFNTYGVRLISVQEKRRDETPRHGVEGHGNPWRGRYQMVKSNQSHQSNLSQAIYWTNQPIKATYFSAAAAIP